VTRPFLAGARRPAALRALLAALCLATPSARAADVVDRVVVVTSDWQTGGVSLLDPAAGTVRTDIAPACPDAVVRAHGGLLYVVNRTGCDNIEVVDPATGEVLHEFSVGNGTNPQDIAVISPSRAYVSRYETNDLLEVDLDTGARVDSISLAPFADADGLCEMHRMRLAGDRLFVELQRMVRHTWPELWVAEPPSMLAVVDVRTRRLVDVDPALPGVQAIALAGINPVAPIVVDPESGDLLVPEAGQYGVLDAGGIERVDPVTLQSEGFLVREETLGGDLVDFAIMAAGREGDRPARPPERLVFAIVSLAGYNTVLLRVDADAGIVVDTLRNPGGYTLADILLHDGKLFLSDRDYGEPGIRVYDAITGQPLAGPISTGLPPVELVLLPGVSPTPPIAGGGILGRVVPNPSPGPVRLAWRPGPADPPVRLEVFDPAGRLVRKLGLPGAWAVADSSVAWDGRDDEGRRVRTGVYFLRGTAAAGASGTRSVRIVLR
jgi:hypothetical protein